MSPYVRDHEAVKAARLQIERIPTPSCRFDIESNTHDGNPAREEGEAKASTIEVGECCLFKEGTSGDGGDGRSCFVKMGDTKADTKADTGKAAGGKEEAKEESMSAAKALVPSLLLATVALAAAVKAAAM